jgi:hypothetical protein
MTNDAHAGGGEEARFDVSRLIRHQARLSRP